MKAGFVWSVFALGVAIAAGVMVWASVMLADLETAHAEATHRTLADQNVRAALWQLESELTPLITDEATRPYFHYAAFYPAEGAYTRMFGDLRPDEPLLPSPLLGAEPGKVQLYFQYEPDGELTSPQAPSGEKERLALRYLQSAQVQVARQRLSMLGREVTRDELVAQLPSRQFAPGEAPALEMVYADENWAAQAETNVQGYNDRSLATKKAAAEKYQTNAQQMRQEASLGAVAVNIREGPMTAVWHGDLLLLARRISLDNREYVQGCLLDWSAIRASLTAASRELLPHADFRQAPLDPSRIEAAHVQRLAALPIEVLPGAVPVEAPGGVSPLRATLYVAWACMALVAGSLAFVLRRTLALSARREEFVSAVTHELRTPLTTFRMYTEMLQSGRVQGDAAREYYDTLHNEALRLGHLVENVLAYARLERGRREDRIETLPLSRLMERATERLAQRAQQAGMELEIAPCPDVTVQADPGAVEQVLFNLVDNACKYAPGTSIEIGCETDARHARISVRDHGPGISGAEAAKLFQPFRKSAQQAANSAPGVGLGLALSRRLARAMGGELALDGANRDGCRFLLTLPRK